MTDHLLLVALGPVQDFIAAARRCQDLWFGSWILSDLSRVTAETIQAKRGALIFPAGLDGRADGKRPAVANKILAVVPAGVDPRDVAGEARARMQERLRKLAVMAHDSFGDKAFFDDHLREIALRQIDDLMEFHWAAVPLPDAGRHPETYAVARAQVERVLGARKNRRSWKQVALAEDGGWGAGVFKSSMDGQRESALHEALYDALRGSPRPGFPAITAEKAAELYFVGPAERLCGVGLLKRAGTEDERFEAEIAAGGLRRPFFHSTSHVASAPIRTRIAARGLEASVDAYARELFRACPSLKARRRLTLHRAEKAGVPLRSPFGGEGWIAGEIETPAAFGEERLDGAALYAGQLPAILGELQPGFAELRLSKHEDVHAQREEILKPIRRALGDLLRKLDLSEDDVPTYYATLIADGDSMGEALKRAGREKGIEGHQGISKALDAFARGCGDIVDAHAGSLIYAGGDDVLALLPLHTVMACARALHQRFEVVLEEALRALGFEDGFPTLSMGIGIGHHLDDMADTRRLAKGAEKRAKEYPGKSAIAVSVQMRSGGVIEVVGGFDVFHTSLPVDRRIGRWAELLLAEEIPDKAAFDLEKEMAPLLAGGAARELSDEARSLARRVLGRKRGERGAAPLSDTVRSLVDDYLLRGDVASAVHGLSHELQIARLVARAMRVAYESPQHPKEA
jgi:CRISPR-associated protein Cmr2